MLAGTGQGGQCQPLQEGPPGKMYTHSLIHLSWAQAQLFLGLLLKEVTVFLLFQLAVVPLDFPIGLFHIIIHELVHDWYLVKEVHFSQGDLWGTKVSNTEHLSYNEGNRQHEVLELSSWVQAH